MPPTPKRRKWRPLIAAALIVSAEPSASAQGPDDAKAARHISEVQERARALVEAGLLRPLTEIMKTMRGRVNGDTIDVDLLEIGGGYFYRFKVLTPDGRVEELYVDGKTPEILTAEQARQRFPKDIAALESKEKTASGTPPEPKLNIADLPPRLRFVMRDLQGRVDGKIIDFDFHRVANSPIFYFDLRTDKGATTRFFVHAKTGEIRTPEQARDGIERRFPWLVNELYPPAPRPNEGRRP
jgi:uncharacterized membrane protein YkoI